MSEEKINPKYHRKTDKPCFQDNCSEQVYEHIPRIAGITFDNCRESGNYPMLACFTHFHAVWAGEY